MSEPDRTERAANLFDLRRIIGGLFVVWGVLLVVLGLVGMGEVENSENINLFAGLGMLALGIVFLLWAFTRPLGQELAEASQEASGPAGGDGERSGGRGGSGGH
jgi:hypothetical protein